MFRFVLAWSRTRHSARRHHLHREEGEGEGVRVFGGCASATAIATPDSSTTSIGEGAFNRKGFSGLVAAITTPDSATSMMAMGLFIHTGI